MTNLEELREQQRRNLERRREFVKRWAEYVRTHPDEEWSRQQDVVIDAQIRRDPVDGQERRGPVDGQERQDSEDGDATE